MKSLGKAFLDGLKPVVQYVYRKRYGVRPYVKPLLNWNFINQPFYRWKYYFWIIEEDIYQWTGLPDEWWIRVVGKR